VLATLLWGRRTGSRLRGDRSRCQTAPEAPERLEAGDLDWTIFRPPRLTNGRPTGTYRTALGRNLKGANFISRADVAHAMLTAIGRRETVREEIGIAD
jgi:putative NADH-flavin reductase